jgi:hypothetical protein
MSTNCSVIEVETKRAAKTRTYGCLLTPATLVQDDAAEAARDKITPINHDAAMRLYNPCWPTGFCSTPLSAGTATPKHAATLAPRSRRCCLKTAGWESCSLRL